MLVFVGLLSSFVPGTIMCSRDSLRSEPLFPEPSRVAPAMITASMAVVVFHSRLMWAGLHCSGWPTFRARQKTWASEVWSLPDITCLGKGAGRKGTLTATLSALLFCPSQEISHSPLGMAFHSHSQPLSGLHTPPKTLSFPALPLRTLCIMPGVPSPLTADSSWSLAHIMPSDCLCEPLRGNYIVF